MATPRERRIIKWVHHESFLNLFLEQVFPAPETRTIGYGNDKIQQENAAGQQKNPEQDQSVNNP